MRLSSYERDDDGAVLPYKGFKFGCDPELFIYDGKYPVSAEGIIPGTKSEPYPVPGGAIQRDGMAAEFNIDPVSSFKAFDENIERVLVSLRDHLPKGCTLRDAPAVEFSPEVFEKASDDAKALGCSPDFDAWTGCVNPPPNTDAMPYLRTAAGHLHIGWTEDASLSDLQHITNCRDLVQQLDWYLGGWSLQRDLNPIRRNFYGKAGACRYKPYGVEYRVLSNFWVLDKASRLSVWNRMQAAIHDMRNKFIPAMKGAHNWNASLIQMINSSYIDNNLVSNMAWPLRDKSGF